MKSNVVLIVGDFKPINPQDWDIVKLAADRFYKENKKVVFGNFLIIGSNSFGDEVPPKREGTFYKVIENSN